VLAVELVGEVEAEELYQEWVEDWVARLALELDQEWVEDWVQGLAVELAAELDQEWVEDWVPVLAVELVGELKVEELENKHHHYQIQVKLPLQYQTLRLLPKK
jgi:hypothetical protein